MTTWEELCTMGQPADGGGPIVAKTAIPFPRTQWGHDIRHPLRDHNDELEPVKRSRVGVVQDDRVGERIVNSDFRRRRSGTKLQTISRWPTRGVYAAINAPQTESTQQRCLENPPRLPRRLSRPCQ